MVMEQKEKKDLKIIVAIFLASYFITFIYLFVNVNNINGSKELNSLKQQNEILETQFDSLAQENKAITKNILDLDNKIDSLSDIDSVYQNKFYQNETEIKNLQKKYNKINHIDTFKSNDIKKYFSNLR
jgi:peptidoglycan hydrolase CwlO-like protein